MSTLRRGAMLTREECRTTSASQNRAKQSSVSGPADGGAINPVVHASLREIERLREENEMLRQSAQTFGALAERLHVALQRQRTSLASASSGTPRESSCSY